MAKYDHVTVKLVGEDGNAFAIMARVSNAMRAAGCSVAERDAYREEAMAGDYDHLLRVTMETVNVE